MGRALMLHLVSGLAAAAVACSHGAARQAGDRPAYAAARARSAELGSLPIPSDDDVKSWSHRLLDAYDRADVGLLDVALSPQAVHFEGGKPITRAELLAELKARKPDEPRIGDRSWQQEQVIAGPQGAVFIGRATEHSIGNASHGGNEYVGWYKLVWAPAAERYQVLYWGWQPAGPAAAQAAWDAIYQHGTGYDPRPNQLLVDTTAERPPGRALLLAMGQGRNALYLASRGWQVTGVDYSAEAMRQARERAAAQKLELELVQQDLNRYDFGVAKWDLVTMLYATDSRDWILRSQRSLKRGGLFVYEYFAPDQPGEGVDAVKLATLFEDGYDILRNEVVHARPDWASDEATLLRFVAKKR